MGDSLDSFDLARVGDKKTSNLVPAEQPLSAASPSYAGEDVCSKTGMPKYKDIKQMISSDASIRAGLTSCKHESALNMTLGESNELKFNGRKLTFIGRF